LARQRFRIGGGSCDDRLDRGIDQLQERSFADGNRTRA